MSDPTSTPALEAASLVRHFASGKATLEVLRGVDLTVRPAEIAAIVGPSGSGKSTLLHCLGGLDRPTSGVARVGGVDLWDLADADRARVRNRQVGFVFQSHHLLPDFDARENVMLPMLISGRDKADAAARALRLLDDVGLAPRATHAPSELSGGEQQRVAVARALANGPAVVLADEPSGNLDARASEGLHELLDELRRERGATFLLATHDPELARRADRVLAIRDGRLELVGREHPATWVTPSHVEVQS
jgi:lipoprotein-releasing system ATP-binding protein